MHNYIYHYTLCKTNLVFFPFLYVILLYYRITSTHNLSVVKSIAEAIGDGYDIPAVKGETIFVLS